MGLFSLIELGNGNIASGSRDNTIKIWNRNGECLKTLTGHSGTILSLAETSDGKLVSASRDKTIKIWE